MNYAGLIKNDIASGEGVCVSFFVQGCPYRCKGCHNPQTWSFNGGKEFTIDTLEEIMDALKANGIQRNFCLLGGEPLCNENAFLSYLVVSNVRTSYPDIKIYVWSGSQYEDLMNSSNPFIHRTLNLVDYLIDGLYVEEERDITLPMCGSRNQRVIDIKEKKVLGNNVRV